MSDEELYFDEDDQEPQDQDNMIYEEDQGAPTLDTPEAKYQAAKESLGFDDLYSVDLFYEVFCDENADKKLQSKSLKHAAITLSQHDDFERVLGALTDVFQAHDDELIDDKLCSQIVSSMMTNLLRSEEGLTKFLELATEKVNKSTQLSLYMDLKLRQAELSMRKAYYEEVKEYLSNVEQYCCFPPDPNDRQMCSAAVRILILKIELVDAYEKDEDQMFAYYKQFQSIPEIPLNARQNAVLTKIQGLLALHERKFKEAREKFYKAFQLFDEAGSDKRIHCLPYLALAAMCSREREANVFLDPQIMHYKQHALVAPLDQLLDSYQKSNIVEYNQRIESASKVLFSKYYDSLLNEIRLFVLRGAIQRFCQSYKRVKFEYVAKKLECKPDEVVSQVYDLILSHELRALVDNDTIIMQEQKKPSPYLLNVKQLIDAMEGAINGMGRKMKLKI
ncbi:hypothetical protein TRFO_12865 [Tritrichomonas foetus]|uniref:PCI domain-containing protein n=1 Tax=Tritrichomonas foetus TaxID=1144522 RepID=A0A1J4KZW6_9EUKA|nr:hypothetical protein TRFO_12865 [Tritrichomonas foetus]|eukprot:OHT16799.1 hypothetical protein TRFO_12865 [Tritrichomonas foetus]